MKNLQRLLLFLLVFSCQDVFAFSEKENVKKNWVEIIKGGDTLPHDSIQIQISSDSTLKKLTDKQKVIAAVLAFPVPFGMLGLHRIYLGTDPWVPVVYIFTLGGGFGLLPMIDFFEIVFSDDQQFESFRHNPKIFMWN